MKNHKTKQRINSNVFRKVVAAFTGVLFTVSSNSAYAAQLDGWTGSNAPVTLNVSAPTNTASTPNSALSALGRGAGQTLSRKEVRRMERATQPRIPEDRMRGAGRINRGIDPGTIRMQPVTTRLVAPIVAPIAIPGANAKQLARQEKREAKQAAKQERRQLRQNGARIRLPQPIETVKLNASGRKTDGSLGTLHVRNGVFQELENGRSIRLDNGADLDFGSTTRNITLGDKLFKDGGFITITVGGESKKVYAGSEVTAAEYAAVKQVLGGGSQQLIVDASGKASGGMLNLNSLASGGGRMKVGDLTINSGVTATGDLSKGSSIRLKGDLDNSGTLYLYASNENRASGEIRADNITNQEGATISSKTPADLGAQLGSKASNVNLLLTTDNDFTNLGTIESSGDLTITAAGTLKNVGGGSTLTADKNVNLLAPNLVNQGSVSARAGDITLDTPIAAALNVNNLGGRLQAFEGSINVRAPNYSAAYDSTVFGGNFVSRQLNMNTGGGLMNVDVGQVTGVVSQKGTAAHFKSATEGVLRLGEICLTGDPTYYNTAGSIDIAGNISAGEAVTIIARGAITGNGRSITANAANGFPITLIAGANVTGITPFGSGNQSSVTGASNTSGAARIDGTTPASADGGIISLTNSQVNARVTVGGNNNGADFLAVALRGNTSGAGGYVDFSGTTINTGGNGSGSNGSVTIFAGATGQTSGLGQLGTINTTGGSGTPGNVTVSLSQAQSTGGNIEYNASGALQTGVDLGSFQAGPIQATGSSLSLLGPQIVAGSGNVTISADSHLSITGTHTAGSFSMTSSNGNVFAGGSITTTGSTNITATTGTATFSGELSAGTDLTITSGGATTFNFASASASDNMTVSGSSIVRTGESTTLSATNMSLTATSGDIGISEGIKTATDTLTVTASGSARILEADAISLGNSTVGAAKSFIFNQESGASGDVTVAGTLSGGNNSVISITTQSGNDILISSPLGSITGTQSSAINLVSGGSINIQGTVHAGDTGSLAVLNAANSITHAGSAQITAGTVNLSAGGSIGASGADVLTTATNVIANAGSNVFITETDAVNLGASSVGGSASFNLSAGGSVNVTGPVTAGNSSNIKITTTGGVGSNIVIGNTISGGTTSDITLTSSDGIDVQGNVTSATGTVTLDAANNITRSAVAGMLTGLLVKLNATAGNIGATGGFDPNERILTAATNLNVTADGSAYISQIGAVNLLGATAGNDFQLNATGHVFVDGNITAAPITIVTSGPISLSSDLTANGGILLVSGMNVSTIAAGVDINSGGPGGGGNIVIIAGAEFNDLTSTVEVTGASSNGGSIDFKSVPINSLTSASTSGSNDGGDISLIAYAHPLSGSLGTVNVDSATVTITSGGSGTGAGGTVMIVLRTA